MRPIHALRNDQRGNVLMLTGLSILFLFAMAGAGVDFGRQQLVRMKLQNASDAAAIAAASMPASTSVDQRRQVAQRYFNLNYPTSYLGVTRPDQLIEIGDTIKVSANTAFNTNFVAGVGVNRLESEGRTVVNRDQAQPSNYDVILVMDNSGSMGYDTTAPNFARLNSSEERNTRNLFELICRQQEYNRLNYYCTFDRNNVPMGNGTMASYGSPANCRAQAPTAYCNSIISGARRTVGSGPSAYDIPGYGLTSNSRLNALRYVARNFVTRIIEEGNPGSRMGIVRWADITLQPRGLTNNVSLLNADITNMTANNGTNPYRAMQQAQIYSRNFAPDHIKAVVLMTDGKPTQLGDIDYTRQFGPFTDSSNCDGRAYCGASANQTNTICTQLKNDGVQVYTVGFLNQNDREFATFPGDYQQAVSFLRNCASIGSDGNPLSYTAQNGAELEEAFSKILNSLGKIRIAQ